MLLLTGATGSIGSRLLPLLLESGEDVRCLVREPRRLGARRVDVQIALGDLGEMSRSVLVRQALRGVDTVIHLAATIRDQPPQADRGAERAGDGAAAAGGRAGGVRRFVFFSALDARQRSAPASSGPSGWPSRRSSPRRCRRRSSRPRSSTTTATPGSPSYAASPSCRCCRSPARAGRSSSRSGRGRRPLRGRRLAAEARPRYELAGPETLSYDEMSDLVSRIAGRPRRPRPRAAAADPRQPDRGALRLRRGRVCDLGGGRADGGLRWSASGARPTRRPSESSREG